MICPVCKGAKNVIASHVSYADGTHGYNVEHCCDQCKGDGIVPDEMTDWIRVGRTMRAARIEANRNLREEAKQRGIDVVTLSRMEQGKIRPDPRKEARS